MKINFIESIYKALKIWVIQRNAFSDVIFFEFQFKRLNPL
jgi:hypothetical protein